MYAICISSTYIKNATYNIIHMTKKLKYEEQQEQTGNKRPVHVLTDIKKT